MFRALRLAVLAALAASLALAQISHADRVRMDPHDLGGNRNREALSTAGRMAPAYVSGGVRMSDGRAVPKEAAVHLFCGGFPRASQYVSAKGEFDLDLENGVQGVVDATRSSAAATGLPERNALGLVNLNGCVVRAELHGYDSTEIALGMHSTLDDPNIGDLLLTRQQGLIGDTVSATSLIAPGKAVKNYDRALDEVRKPRANLTKAAERLEAAVAEYSSYAAAWNLLGEVRLKLGLDIEARQAFERAVAADERYLSPYPPLVKLWAAAGDMERTAALGVRALALNPNLDEVRFFLCAAQLRAGRADEAIATAQSLVDRDDAGRYPQAHQILGAAYANKGDFGSAARHFREFLAASPDATASGPIRAQLAEWEAGGAAGAP